MLHWWNGKSVRIIKWMAGHTGYLSRKCQMSDHYHKPEWTFSAGNIWWRFICQAAQWFTRRWTRCRFGSIGCSFSRFFIKISPWLTISYCYTLHLCLFRLFFFNSITASYNSSQALQSEISSFIHESVISWFIFRRLGLGSPSFLENPFFERLAFDKLKTLLKNYLLASSINNCRFLTSAGFLRQLLCSRIHTLLIVSEWSGHSHAINDGHFFYFFIQLLITLQVNSLGFLYAKYSR